MNTIYHILAKDFRRLRVSLLVWIGLQVALVALGRLLVVSAGYGLDLPDGFSIGNATGNILVALLGFGICVSLLREDPPADAGAFWITRPITGAHLLSAKLLGMLLFVCLPTLLAGWVWWQYSGLSGMPLSIAFWSELSGLVAVVLLAFACAPFLKRESSIFAVLAAVLVSGFGLFLTFVAVVSSRQWALAGGEIISIVPPLAVLVLSIVASVAGLYLGRWRKLSAGFVIGGVFASVAVMLTSPNVRIVGKVPALKGIQITETHFEGNPWGGVALKGKVGPLAGNRLIGDIFRSPSSPETEKSLPYQVAVVGQVSGGQLEEALVLRRNLAPHNASLRVDLPELGRWRTDDEVLVADKPKDAAVPGFSTTLRGYVTSITALPDLSLVEGSKVQSKEGPAVMEAVRVLDKDRIEIQFARFVSPGTKGTSFFYVVDRKGDRVCLAGEAHEKMAAFIYGVIFERRLHAFTVQQLHPEPFISRAERDSWLAGLSLVQVEQHTDGRIEIPIKVEACSLSFPPPNEELRARLKRNYDRKLQKEKELEAQMAREQAGGK